MTKIYLNMNARLILFLKHFLLLSVSSFAQNAGDYKSVATGGWTATTTWQVFDGTNWEAATNFPGSADGIISLTGGFTVTVPSGTTISADQIMVLENAQLIVSANAVLDIVNGTGNDLDIAQAVTGTVPGIVKVHGTLKAQNDVNIISATNSLSVENGGLYEHNFTTSNGNIPLASWQTGSTLLISGYTTNTLAPGNLGQSFHHVHWNTANLNNSQGYINIGGALKTVNGNLTVSSTGTDFLNYSETTDKLLVQGDFIINNNRKIKVNAPVEITKTLHLLNSTLENTSGLILANGATFLFEGSSLLKGVAPTASGAYNVYYKNLSTTFAPGPELPLNGTALAGLMIENGSLSLNGNLTVNENLTIALAGVLKLNGYDLFLKKNFINNGTFEAGTNKVVFNGAATQSIEGTMPTTFHILEVVNTANPGLLVKQHSNISHSLVLGENTTLDPDGGDLTSDGGINFTLLSNSFPHAAFLAPIPATATIAGNVVVQRFIPPPPAVENKYLTTSTQGATVGQWTDDFVINGPYEGGNGQTSSAFIFDEYKVATSTNPYVEFPGASGSLRTPVEVGKGYSTNWFETSKSIVVDTRGPVTTGDFIYPLSYTAEGTSSNKGFNLVGNPYPSAIDWSSPAWQRKDISPTAMIFIREGGKSSRITWNSVTGIGLNSPNNSIPSGQAFFVKALSSTASLVATENIKVKEASGDMQKALKDVIVITFSNNTFRDQTALAFRTGATAGFDPLLDSEKIKNGTINLYSVAIDGQNLSQNVQPWFTTCSYNFPLTIDQAAAGVYQLSFSHLNSLSKSLDILLQDNYLNTSTAVTPETVYKFDITSDPLTYGTSRFSLTFSNSPAPEITSVTYEGSCTGSIPVTVGGTVAGINYQLFNGTTAVTDAIAATSETTIFSVSTADLAEGSNTITVKAFHTGCDPVNMATQLLLDYSGNYTISSTSGGSSCTTGPVTLSATASSTRASYRWYETLDATTAVHEGTTGSYTTPVLTSSKTYYVAAVNVYGCESPRTAVEATIDIQQVTSLSYQQSCTGSIPVTVNGTVAGINYQLFNGTTAVSDIISATSNTTTLPAKTSGLTEGSNTITVVATTTGCQVTMDRNLLLDYSGNYTISSTEGATSCSTGSVTLSATASSTKAAYRWYESLDASTPVYEAATGFYNTPALSSSKTYYVAAVNAYGCESPRTAVEATIENYTKPVIRNQDGALVSSFESGNQWLLNGQPIPNATEKSIIPEESGTYGLEVSHNGCTLVADNVQLTVTGIEDMGKVQYPIFYPNPAAEIIHINPFLFEKNEEVHYYIYQASGTILQEGKVKENEQILFLGNLKMGLYLLKIVEGDKTYFEKLIKK